MYFRTFVKTLEIFIFKGCFFGSEGQGPTLTIVSFPLMFMWGILLYYPLHERLCLRSERKSLYQI